MRDIVYEDDGVKTAMVQWLGEQAADFCEDGVRKLIARYDKWLIIGGNYAEDWIKIQAFKIYYFSGKNKSSIKKDF